jgi:D-sedoheptulose 7-phosphate isomerase
LALRAAREMGIVTVGLLGGSGEPALAECDLALLVPDSETARIQECHISLGHAVLELLEDRLIARPLP